MKGVLGIITGIFIGCLVLLCALAGLRAAGPFQATRLAAAPSATTPSPLPVKPSPAPSASPVPASRSTPARTTSPVSPRPIATTPPASQAAKNPQVDLDLSVTGVSGSGFSRQVTAGVTNAGTGDAHNAVIKLEASCQGSPVKLGGSSYLQESLGTLKAGETRQVETDLSFSLPDGTRILKNGVQFVITLSSDEQTRSLNYSYKP